jgi:hypothetical protein
MKNAIKYVLFLFIMGLSAAFVTAASNAPAINSISAQTINEGGLLTFTFTSTAADSGSTIFKGCVLESITGDCKAAYASAGVTTDGHREWNVTTVTATTGQFSFAPTFFDSGVWYFNLSASDTDSTNTTTFQVTVNNLNPSLSISPSPITLGSENQERSDPNHDTTSKRELNVSTTITITNGGEPVTGLVGSVSYASGFSSNDIRANFTLPKISLGAGESISVPVSFRVPEKIDAVTSDDLASAFKVASMTFTATPTITTSTAVVATSDVNMQAENNLKIKSVKVKFLDKSDTVEDGDTVKDLKPGYDVEFDVELENKFSTKQDVNLQDIEIQVTSDSELDIDESEEPGDLSAGESDTTILTSTIDSDADDGTYEVVITADANDEFDARHGEKMTISFEIKRQSHEIEITGMTLTPQSVLCEKSTTLKVDLKNSGRKDEEAVYVRIAAPDLNFGQVSDKLSIDKDDTGTAVFTIPVASSTLSAGNYRITVESYFNTGTKSSSDGLLLNLQGCKPVTTVTPPPSDVVVKNVTTVTLPPPTNNSTNGNLPVEEKKPFFESNQYLALLVLGYIVVIAGGVALILKLLQK